MQPRSFLLLAARLLASQSAGQRDHGKHGQLPRQDGRCLRDTIVDLTLRIRDARETGVVRHIARPGGSRGGPEDGRMRRQPSVRSSGRR